MLLFLLALLFPSLLCSSLYLCLRWLLSLLLLRLELIYRLSSLLFRSLLRLHSYTSTLTISAINHELPDFSLSRFLTQLSLPYHCGDVAVCTRYMRAVFCAWFCALYLLSLISLITCSISSTAKSTTPPTQAQANPVVSTGRYHNSFLSTSSSLIQTTSSSVLLYLLFFLSAPGGRRDTFCFWG